MEKRRNQEGQFTPEKPDDDVLSAVRAHDPAATSEIADEVDMTRQGADRRLRKLRDAGKVSSKKIGASLVWFIPRERTGLSSSDTSPGEQRTPPTAEAHVDETPIGDDDPIGDALEGWDPGTETPVETARAQTRRAVAYLREQGGRHKRTSIVDALADESTLSDRVWWERAVQPGLRHLADEGLVEYRPGYHDYKYVGGSSTASQTGP